MDVQGTHSGPVAHETFYRIVAGTRPCSMGEAGTTTTTRFASSAARSDGLRRRVRVFLAPRTPSCLKPVVEVLQVGGGSQLGGRVVVDRADVGEHALGELAQAPDRREAGRGLRDGERVNSGRRQSSDDMGRGEV